MSLVGLLVTGPDGRYHPGIGDPTFLGWLTFAGYVGSAYSTFRARRVALARARSVGDPARARDATTLARVFGLLTVLLVALGINKQLDLQTLFIEIVRDHALESGWYPDRRRYQVAFVAAIAVLGAIGTLVATFVLRRVARRIAGAILGTAFLVVYVVVRAASFHHIEAFIGARPGLNPLLELTGIAMIARSAYRYSRTKDA